MASITIRTLDEDVKTRRRVRAAGNGRLMEEEARLILRDAVGRKPGSRNLADGIRHPRRNAQGLGMRVLPSGAKRFLIHTRHRGERFWKIIGDANSMTLA